MGEMVYTSCRTVVDDVVLVDCFLLAGPELAFSLFLFPVSTGSLSLLLSILR